MIGIFKIYGLNYFENDASITMIGALATLANGLSRIFWATMLDYYIFKRIFGFLIILQISCILTLGVSTGHIALYGLVVIVSYQCEGGVSSMLTTHCVNYFGVARGRLTYSFMFSCIGLSSLTGSFIVKYLQDIIGYKGMFSIAFVLTCVSLAILKFIKGKKFDYVKAMQNQDDGYKKVQNTTESFTGSLV